jgi:hypothetical protein
MIGLFALLATSALLCMLATDIAFRKAGLVFVICSGLVMTLAVWSAIVWLYTPVLAR